MLRKFFLLCFLSGSIAILHGQAIDRSFISPLSSNDGVYAMALQSNGKIIIGGGFVTTGRISKKIVRLNVNGSIDSSFNVGTNINGAVNEIVLQPDGKLLVGGYFTATNNSIINKNLVRLLPDGTLDNTFNIGSGVDGVNNSVQAILVDPAGKIYVGGDITQFNGQGADMLIRLNANGTLDNSFVKTAEYTGSLISLALQADGKLLAGGVIARATGSSRPAVMIRLNTDGSLDNGFQVSSTSLNSVNSIVVLSNNKILAGGDFQNYNGKPYSGIVRLETNGTVDESFKVGSGFYAIYGGIYSFPLYIVSNIALTSDGKIVVAGYFREYNATHVDGIIQLNSDGSIFNTLQACEKYNLSGNIYNIVVQQDDKILAGGYFGDFRNEPVATNVLRLLRNPASAAAPVANFDFTATGDETSFIDSTKNALSYEWYFGDGIYSTVSNPVHKYAGSGAYNVSLTVRGYCDVRSTLSKRVTIVNLQSNYPTKGGNDGTVVLNVKGAYFTDKSSVKLSRNGKDIVGKDVLLADNGRTLYTSLDLHRVELGVYDLVVTTGTNVATLKNSFTVDPAKQMLLSVNIDGRDTVRTGSYQKYNIEVSNQSNVDAKGVPVWLAVPKGSTISFGFTIVVPKNIADINYDSIPLFAETDTLFSKPGNYDVYGFIIRNVPSGQSRKLPFEIRFLSTGDMHAWVAPPMYGSPVRAEVGTCMYGLLSLIAKSNPFTDCARGAFDNILEPIILTNNIAEIDFKYKKYGKQETPANKIQLNELYDEAITASEMTINMNLASCLSPLKESKARNYKYFKELQRKTLEETRYAWGLIKDTKTIFTPENDDNFKLGKSLEKDDETLKACKEVLIRLGFIKRTVTTVGSMDPNEKVGPYGTLAANHILPSTPFLYSIYFENVSTATAPAQEVIIIDTLNKSVFDMKTFQLTGFGFGKYATTKINPGLFEYAGLIDLRPSNNLLVKVNAKLDTARGILTWRLFSIDPKTMDLPEDPLAGFLPPNNAENAGQGFVSYSILPKAGLPDKTVLSNKALIYFDYNAPIATNTFYNTIDINLPDSKVEPLPNQTADTTFKVAWGGSDQSSGVRSYDIYYSVNNGAFKVWKYEISATQSMFTGKRDSTYKFYSIARDYAGNVENAKQSAEATTQVKATVTGIVDLGVDGHFNVYPNPFQQTVTLDLDLPSAEKITVVIMDLTGRIVKTVFSDKLMVAGKNKIVFEASSLANGVYLCELTSKKYKKVVRLVKERL